MRGEGSSSTQQGARERDEEAKMQRPAQTRSFDIVLCKQPVISAHANQNIYQVSTTMDVCPFPVYCSVLVVFFLLGTSRHVES